MLKSFPLTQVAVESDLLSHWLKHAEHAGDHILEVINDSLLAPPKVVH